LTLRGNRHRVFLRNSFGGDGFRATRPERQTAMTVVSDGFLREVEERRVRIRASAENLLLEARAQGREQLNEPEAIRHQATLTDLRELDEHIAEVRSDLERRVEIDSSLAPLRHRLGITGNPDQTRKTAMHDQHLTYRRNDHRASWLRDLILTNQQRDDTGECRRRLAAHAEDVRNDPFFDRPEYRDITGLRACKLITR
jgi:hypothetical protein